MPATFLDPEQTDPTFRPLDISAEPYSWLASGFSTQGLVRASNDDAWAVVPGRAFVVADGIGGQPGGGFAARLAVDTFVDVLGERSGFADAVTALGSANENVLARRTDAGFPEAGTTFVSMTTSDDSHCAVVWCGDSRLYRFRDGRLELLTRDHTVRNEVASSGAPEADLQGVPLGALTRCVGSQLMFEPDVLVIAPHIGDRYLLCSDGISGQLSARQIEEAMVGTTVGSTALALAHMADVAGGRDNATALVVEVVPA